MLISSLPDTIGHDVELLIAEGPSLKYPQDHAKDLVIIFASNLNYFVLELQKHTEAPICVQNIYICCTAIFKRLHMFNDNEWLLKVFNS